MNLISPNVASDWTKWIEALRCVDCEGVLCPTGPEPSLGCSACGKAYPIRDDVLVVKEQPASDNQITADFYNSPLWPRFRFWERVFFALCGGERRARQRILRHLPQR